MAATTTASQEPPVVSDHWSVKDRGSLLNISVRHNTVQKDGVEVQTVSIFSDGVGYAVDVVLPPEAEDGAYAHTLREMTIVPVNPEIVFHDGTHKTFVWLLTYERGAMRAFVDSWPRGSHIRIDVEPWRDALASAKGIDDYTKTDLAHALE